MDILIGGLIAGLIAGSVFTWLWLRKSLGDKTERAISEQRERNADLSARNEMLEEQAKNLQTTQDELNQKLANKNDEIRHLESDVSKLNERLLQEQKQADEKLALMEDAKQKLNDAFKAMSAEALKTNNETFLNLAQENLSRFQQGAVSDLDKRGKEIEQLAKPVHDSLEKMDNRLGELEKVREGAYAAIREQITSMAGEQDKLRSETANLVRALRQPQARGRWGELQLKRVVEMAGMLDHCDFTEQTHIAGEQDERAVRPDMIVNLPLGRHIVVDSKVPLAAYLDAVESDGGEAEALLARHAAQLKTHIKGLSIKAYWDRIRKELGGTPEFVVLFVPGEDFFSAALKVDGSLIEYGVEQKVIVATPTTLIALLKAVSYGWRQEALAQNAEQVAALGKELYVRIQKLSEHWSKVGRHLGQTVRAYNDATGSLEARVLSGARKFELLKTAPERESLSSPEPVEVQPRELTSAELCQGIKNDSGDFQ
ncbi:MAG: DNA recombination protein RmuC [Mariprofundaceae bacterium]